MFRSAEREWLMSEITEAEGYLAKNVPLLEEHLIYMHNGIPTSTCHRCLAFQQGIQSNRKFIDEAQEELNHRDITKV